MARLFNILTEFGIFTLRRIDEIFETSVSVLSCLAWFKTEICYFKMGSFFSYNQLYNKIECYQFPFGNYTEPMNILGEQGNVGQAREGKTEPPR